MWFSLFGPEFNFLTLFLLYLSSRLGCLEVLYTSYALFFLAFTHAFLSTLNLRFHPFPVYFLHLLQNFILVLNPVAPVSGAIQISMTPAHKDDHIVMKHSIFFLMCCWILCHYKRKKFILSSTYSGKPLLIFLVRGVCMYVYLCMFISHVHSVCTHIII